MCSVCSRSCTSGFAVVLDWKDVKEKCVPYSLSRVWRLGNSVLRAKHKKVSPVSSILQHENGRVLIIGKVCSSVTIIIMTANN